MDLASKSYIAPPPAILALGHLGVHVGTTNGGNVSTDIKRPVNKSFHIGLTLSISDINLQILYYSLTLSPK